ncbi:hypothetical protein [Stigmatella erecta]|uniref:Uncharacterized protein n=1 Tax=Stigmatella erecta TaxID=83460 RepID=A0A1I0KS63_9BACT|nr:hypothetical protein [Stigmatella erecta]SEU27708.1 hypothetical protein SAMN05443639_11340 [Stigmatella erecta]
MKKFLLLSVLYALVVLPGVAARERHPVRGLKKAIALMVLFNLCYAFAVLVIWPQMDD